MNAQSSSLDRYRGRGGFTLIELLVVIAILGIIAAIAVPTFLGQRTKAMRSEAITNLESLRLLEEQNYAENGDYTADAGDCTSDSDVNAIQGVLPGFKPGTPGELYFYYCLEHDTFYNGTASGSVPCFRARAKGKNGKPVEGQELIIDCNNEKNF